MEKLLRETSSGMLTDVHCRFESNPRKRPPIADWNQRQCDNLSPSIPVYAPLVAAYGSLYGFRRDSIAAACVHD